MAAITHLIQQPARGQSARVGSSLFVLGLALTCFSGQWGELGIPIPLDRALIVVGIGLTLYGDRDAWSRVLVRPVHLFGAAVISYGLLSVIAVGALSSDSMFALLDRLGFPVVMIIAAPVVFHGEQSRTFLSRAFVVLTLYLCIVSIGQATAVDAIVWPHYILDPNIGIHFDRARGPYVEAVANGMMLTAGIAFCGLVGFCDRMRIWRVVAIATLPLAAVSIVLTLTRAVWIGAALAIAVACMTVRPLRRWLLAITMGIVVLVGGFLAANPVFVEEISSRGGDELSAWDRLNTNAAAVRMIVDHPLTGIGWYQSRYEMSDYVRQGGSYPVTRSAGSIEVHNVFLARFAELGIVGGSLWITLLVLGIIFPLMRRIGPDSLRPWRVVLLCVTVSWLTAAVLGPVSYIQPNYLLWCLGGIMLSDYVLPSRWFSQGNYLVDEDRT